jgi:hypothetical protein
MTSTNRHRPAAAGHPADERAAPSPAGQGKHSPGGQAQTGDHLASPTTSSVWCPGPGQRGTGPVRRLGRRAPPESHPDAPAPRRPCHLEIAGPGADRSAGGNTRTWPTCRSLAVAPHPRRSLGLPAYRPYDDQGLGRDLLPWPRLETGCRSDLTIWHSWPWIPFSKDAAGQIRPMLRLHGVPT